MPATPKAEVIVLGTGGLGSAAAWRLARAGVQVLALEQHPLSHALGSSHGETRMVRQAYFEHPDYVPLLKRAYELWDELGVEFGRPLLHRNGVVIYGPEEGGSILPGVEKSAALHSIPIERMTAAQARQRYPDYVPPPGFRAVLEPGAGYAEVDESVRAFGARARAAGARILEGERVLDWQADANGVTVRTTVGTHQAERLVITAGPWSGPLLRQTGLRLEVRRMMQLWYRTQPGFAATHLPCFAFDQPYGFIYGFPLSGERVKIASHVPGEVLPDGPEALDRNLRPGDDTDVLRCLRQCLPRVSELRTDYSACMYTMTPDAHFVIDRHPESERVVFAAGTSGHGFKFAPVIGEILSELTIRGESRHAIGFLSRKRLTY